jgi:hypothetical protein
VSNDSPTPDPQAKGTTGGPDPVPAYEICVAGRLAPRWSAWFDGLAIDTEADGTTVIRGPVADQAALHGLIQKLRDVGIPLISLTQLPARPTSEPPAHPNQGEQP